jgi:hypothetical protein
MKLLFLGFFIILNFISLCRSRRYSHNNPPPPLPPPHLPSTSSNIIISSSSSSNILMGPPPAVPAKPLQQQLQQSQQGFTTVVYSFCDEEVPYRIKIPGSHPPTLKQFKDYLPKKGNYRYVHGFYVCFHNCAYAFFFFLYADFSSKLGAMMQTILLYRRK